MSPAKSPSPGKSSPASGTGAEKTEPETAVEAVGGLTEKKPERTPAEARTKGQETLTEAGAGAKAAAQAGAGAEKTETRTPPENGTKAAPESGRKTAPAAGAKDPAKAPAKAEASGTGEAVAATAAEDGAAVEAQADAGAGTATATATATATETKTEEKTGKKAGEEPGKPGALSKPALAAAGLAGVLLLCSPFVVNAMLGGDEKDAAQAAANHQAAGGGDGFVPGAEEPGGGGGKGPGKADGGHAKAGGGSAGHGTGTGEGGAGGDGADSGDGGSGEHVDGASGKKTDGDDGSGSKGAGGGSGAEDDGGKDDGETKSGGGSHDSSSSTTTSSSGGGSATTKDSGTSSGSGTTTSKTNTTARQSPASFNAVAGPYCSNAGATWIANGRYTDGDRGWTTSEGGYSGAGCGSRFVSIPMSGDAGSDDSNYARYTFTTGAVKSGSCTVEVYIPASSSIERVGGHPTYYTVHDAANGSGESYVGNFSVNQTTHRGSWVSGGRFPVHSGVLSVKLHTRGIDYGSTWKNAHHASSAVRVNCSA
jgi:translation initiation factor IF-2